MKAILSRLRSALLPIFLATCTLGAAQAHATLYVPYSTPFYSYTVQSDIVYGQGEVDFSNGGGTFTDLKLDLYIPDIPPPAKGANQIPLMLMIHGGAFQSGSKDNVYNVLQAQEYAMRGWLVALIDYRLESDDPVPSSRVTALYDYVGGASATLRDRTAVAAIDDTLAALDFLQARGDVKKSWTTLWGDSAGGNTALGTSYALDDHGISRPSVAVVIDLAGRFDGKAVGNPFDNTPGVDPVLLDIIGTADPLYPYSLETRAWAIDAGLEEDFEEIEGAEHSLNVFDLISSTGVTLFQRTVDWHYDTIFNGRDPGPQPPSGC